MWTLPTFSQQIYPKSSSNWDVWAGSAATAEAEVFNFINQPYFDTTNRFINTKEFGRVTAAATSTRQIQSALRSEF